MCGDLSSSLECPMVSGGGGCAVYATCQCSAGFWSCFGYDSGGCYEGGLESGPPPACPDPSTLRAGEWCPSNAAGLQCPGNPQWCDGAEFYDALQCDGATWITLAATECGDGGGLEAGFDGTFDAGTD
jgi:hypothetical protein